MDVYDSLKQCYKGEVSDDSWTKSYYSVDSSHHQIYPQLICFPKDEDDVKRSLVYAKNHNLSITCRGAGTGLLGQCLSDGLIIDFTKFMNKIITIDTQSNTVIIQPGIVKGVVDKELKKYNKFLPPDPASSNYCTIGGMVSNNSSGAHSLGYGSMIDYMDSVDFIYSDGIEGFAKNKVCDDRLKSILLPLISSYEKIVPYYPNVTKNSCGYRIDSIFKTEFRPQNIFASSEGTLGIFKSLGFKIVDIPLFRSLFLVHFSDILIASKYAKKLLSTKPVAMELLDSSVMDSYIKSTTTFDKNGCLVFVEYFYQSKDKINFISKSLAKKVIPDGKILEHAHDAVSIESLWNSRKNALNMAIKNTVGKRKPLSMIEDITVSVDYLHDYLIYLLMLYREYELHYVIYGHLGNGNLHTRPIIDSNSNNISYSKEKLILEKIIASLFVKVHDLRGTITGEHGDGISRSPFIMNMYGNFVYGYFKYLKRSFDPLNILNRGKKIL